VNRLAGAPLGFVLQPSVFKLEVVAMQSDAALRLNDLSLPFLAIVRVCEGGGQSSLSPLKDAPAITGIGTLNEDLTDTKGYWDLVQERAATAPKQPGRFRLRFKGAELSNMLAKLTKRSGKESERKPPELVLFKALAQRERIFIELDFGEKLRVLAVDPSIVVVPKD
jgi:hypothetical protein